MLPSPSCVVKSQSVFLRLSFCGLPQHFAAVPHLANSRQRLNILARQKRHLTISASRCQDLKARFCVRLLLVAVALYRHSTQCPMHLPPTPQILASLTTSHGQRSFVKCSSCLVVPALSLGHKNIVYYTQCSLSNSRG
jgi:hypothetical protein